MNSYEGEENKTNICFMEPYICILSMRILVKIGFTTNDNIIRKRKKAFLTLFFSQCLSNKINYNGGLNVFKLA